MFGRPKNRRKPTEPALRLPAANWRAVSDIDDDGIAETASSCSMLPNPMATSINLIPTSCAYPL